ncbi:MAG: shikimate dehydrogenase [Verrucomicrobia bacterium]|nr:shikimate dehydrogenase [Verrucomicrobiota bacterium]MCF7708240.1 shikimate dehydrogenase [Verrucomicrobiota bacterium]
MINASTQFCAVYGHPVKHSASPAMQNAGITALDLNWRYLAFDVPAAELDTALAGAAAMRFIGVNLTVPHKLHALEMMDKLDRSASEWGAVNTVLFEGLDGAGRWRPLRDFVGDEYPESVRRHGFNTDADAITESIRESLGISPAGASIVILGAGGAGRVAALKLAAEEATELHLVNRTISKAESLAKEINERYPGPRVTVGYPDTRVDLLVNATSLGLRPDDPVPVDDSVFPLERCRGVYDMIYRPAETALLRKAREAGCLTANGLGMLLYQGAKALEIWSGKPAPLDEMKYALESHIYGAGT